MLCRDGREASKAGAALAEAAEMETLYYVQGGANAWKVGGGFKLRVELALRTMPTCSARTALHVNECLYAPYIRTWCELCTYMRDVIDDRCTQ